MSDNSSTIQQMELSAGWKAIRFFYGVLIFLIAGPPIGSLIFSVGGVAALLSELLWTQANSSLASRPPGDFFGALLLMSFLFALGSYIVGWLPALIAGIIVSAGQVYFSGMSGRNAAIAAVLTSPVASVFLRMNVSSGSAHTLPSGVDALLAIASITATMSCWWILRKGGISGYERS